MTFNGAAQRGRESSSRGQGREIRDRLVTGSLTLVGSKAMKPSQGQKAS